MNGCQSNLNAIFGVTQEDRIVEDFPLDRWGYQSSRANAVRFESVDVSLNYPYILLYDPDDYDENNRLKVQFEYVSSKPLTIPHDHDSDEYISVRQFVKKGDECIFFEMAGILYKMDWNEINSQIDFGVFKKVEGIDLKQCIPHSVPSTRPFFKMLYLEDKQKLFVMRCNALDCPDYGHYGGTSAYGCLLDLSTGKWEMIRPLFHGGLGTQTWPDFLMVYDENIVYILSETSHGGCLERFNLEQSMWMERTARNAPYPYVYDAIILIDSKKNRIYMLKTSDDNKRKNQLYSCSLEGNDEKWDVSLEF
eukprot:CAMPEP_0202707622 /NCGR_PEP_ID=MMETSP1385-20130828/19926_1 /ASSEMBLY_ACC=CAM_ASM_000861 /TAXON_ID=933848 /ORGANISM="Elphidium margaritaceum" /LENGTH=306 /DNA_ID=CAMNT_0049366371 /DNA_START=283 /DNA_END=1203 /DNA_ORIENTATION=-